jgi:signal peptidase I
VERRLGSSARKEICDIKLTQKLQGGEGPFSSGMVGDEKNSTNKRWWVFETRYWLRDLILSVLLAFIVIVFLYQPVQVEGTSMMPRLANHERIFINKFLYRFEPIQRGDIVVFRYPLDPTKSYIKRVVGLPGEWVGVKDGHVLVNGRKLAEPYVPPRYLDHQSYPPVYVEPDHYYVLGDHRGSSNDSRVWGTVDRKYIYGKAVFVYWPFSQMGTIQ